MNLTVVSTFRNSASYIFRYLKQMEYLRKERTDINFHYVFGYGDSTDETCDLLHHLSPKSTDLLDVSHGGAHYGSIVHPTRFKQLAYVGNRLWERIPLDADYVLHIESDLIWRVQDLSCLLKHAERLHGVFSNPLARCIIAPRIMHTDGRFYDTWAFRKDGVGFKNEPPFHSSLLDDENFIELDSVGSCFVLKADLARHLNWPEKDVVVGLCKQARDMGTRIFLDKFVEVYHP